MSKTARTSISKRGRHARVKLPAATKHVTRTAAKPRKTADTRKGKKSPRVGVAPIDDVCVLITEATYTVEPGLGPDDDDERDDLLEEEI